MIEVAALVLAAAALTLRIWRRRRAHVPRMLLLAEKAERCAHGFEYRLFRCKTCNPNEPDGGRSTVEIVKTAGRTEHGRVCANTGTRGGLCGCLGCRPRWPEPGAPSPAQVAYERYTQPEPSIQQRRAWSQPIAAPIAGGGVPRYR
jgi:hypothetical protein